ncbi:hypothetical protein BEP19_09680 [Ammoniphilus oxalaticus]|uniref:Penicillin-binding protein n=1 Tax=Ammoniphilus oxalaticus TaxID=66863 RepID=A0A419SKV3_9BACL|nr:penicillin-binding transpeptidase domain-containing protein [Ammoniphilus oxalaticus]RKD24634.1 hypothetical protein BEP19_09680 [Ammoniphilus oxalaticus]
MLYNEEKKKQQESMISRRAQLLFTIVFIFFAALIIRLAVVQIVKGEEYLQIANENSIQMIPIPAPRGNILDKNGHVLVDNKISYTAVFNEEEWMGKDYILNLANRIAPILNQPVEDILKKMDTGYDANGERVARKDPKFLEKDLKLYLEIDEMTTLAENRSEFKGIDVVVKPVRQYKEQIAVQAIGYVRPYATAENTNSVSDYYVERKEHYLPNQYVGVDGVEFSYEDTLVGENGAKKLLVNARGTLLEELEVTNPKPGSNLYLTIDHRAQADAEAFVANYLTKLRSGGGHGDLRNAKNAYVVALEIETGNIAMMVSHPKYDPNEWVRGVSTERYQDIQFAVTNGAIRSASHDVRPRAFEEAQGHPYSIVPIGSVIKPLTVLIGLNEKLIAPGDRWQDPGAYRYGRGTDTITNAGRRNLGLLTPQIALQRSSNTYMARIADSMVRNVKNPVTTFQQYHHHFGLGVRTGVMLPFESSGTEDYIDTSSQISNLAGLVQASFGQQQRFTTMQLAQFAMTLANKGERLRPQIVDRIETNGVIQKTEPETLDKLELPDTYWNVVREGMIMASSQAGGTAYRPFQGFPHAVAAKTGTSQQDIYFKGKRRSVENATFIGYSPAHNPKLAVAVIVPEAGRGTNSATYIARGIFDIYDKYIGLAGPPPTQENTENTP